MSESCDLPKCGRCGAVIYDVGGPEGCWFCEADLCYNCWDVEGHCGHEEARIVNELGRRNLLTGGHIQPARNEQDQELINRYHEVRRTRMRILNYEPIIND